jgi:hypothetical protein
MGKNVKVKVGDFILEAIDAGGECNFHLSSAHAVFQVTRGKPDISLRFHYGAGPTWPMGQLVFASGGLWSLYEQSPHFIMPLRMPDSGDPYLTAILDRSFCRGDVHIRPLEKDSTPESFFIIKAGSQVSVDPFHYPLDEVLMLNFLAQGQGLILHACGVVDHGQGLLFVGVSGAGKSTLAEWWKGTEATLLSDDRIIVRRVEGRLRIYGTPWQGDARICSPEGAPLETIYLLRHGSQNAVQPLTMAEAATRLLVCCFPPFYDKGGMAFTLEFLEQLASEIPCYELAFVPDARVLDFVRA